MSTRYFSYMKKALPVYIHKYSRTAFSEAYTHVHLVAFPFALSTYFCYIHFLWFIYLNYIHKITVSWRLCYTYVPVDVNGSKTWFGGEILLYMYIGLYTFVVCLRLVIPMRLLFHLETRTIV